MHQYVAKRHLNCSYVILVFFPLIWPRAIASPYGNSTKYIRGEFVARLISTTPDFDAEFKAKLNGSFMPVWKGLKRHNIISAVSLFKVDYQEYAKLYPNDWLYLLLIELEDQVTAEKLFDAEKRANCYVRADSMTFQILRIELMKCTQNSCYGYPYLSYVDAPLGVNYLIEFIGVVESPDSLMKYRQLMSKYFGPANGILQSRGLLHCFIALETEKIIKKAPGVANWNQIHISDHWDEYTSLNWDSVYVDLFQKEFLIDLDSVWNEIPSITDGANCRAHLTPTVYIR